MLQQFFFSVNKFSEHFYFSLVSLISSLTLNILRHIIAKDFCLGEVSMQAQDTGGYF